MYLFRMDIDEILEHCTSLTVLRDGEIMGELTKEDMQKSDIANKIRYLMIGREMTGDYYRSDYDSVCSEVSRLRFSACNNLEGLKILIWKFMLEKL